MQKRRWDKINNKSDGESFHLTATPTYTQLTSNDNYRCHDTNDAIGKHIESDSSFYLFNETNMRIPKTNPVKEDIENGYFNLELNINLEHNNEIHSKRKRKKKKEIKTRKHNRGMYKVTPCLYNFLEVIFTINIDNFIFQLNLDASFLSKYISIWNTNLFAFFFC